MTKNININIINTKAWLYKVIPSFIKHPANIVRKVPAFINWYLSPKGLQHTREVLLSYEGKYKNCRCVVIGNGPSLNSMDLSVLKDEYTFGLNRIYLLFEKLGFETSFYVCSNGLVQIQFANEISKINCPKFLNWEYRRPFQVTQTTAFLCPRLNQSRMDGQILNGYFPTFGTVTNIALQLAFFMGFSEVILIGIDHNYTEKGMPNKAVVAKAEDNNHFSKDYFGPGTIWQLPDYQAMEFGYRAVKEMFEHDSRVVVDATVNGKLHVFKKADFKEYLEKSKVANIK